MSSQPSLSRSTKPAPQPSHRVLTPDAAGERPVLAESLAEVGVQRRGVAGEVRLDDVDGAVAIVVADAHAHAGLRLAVLAVGAARADADVRERAVVVVAIERARVRVVGHVDVGPAVVVEVEGADAETVGAAGARDARLVGDVLERAVAVVVVEHVLAAGKARADRRRPGCPCSGRGPNRASAPWRGRGRCSWRRRGRAGRRGRSRGRRSRCPSACAGCDQTRPAR